MDELTKDFCQLSLADVEPVAVSKHRVVYPHPQASDWLVKVIAPERTNNGSHDKWYKHLRRSGPYRVFASGMREFLISRHAAKSASPIARVVGMVETDLGLGLVVEKIVGEAGELAPSLRDIARRDGFTVELQSMVDELEMAMLEHNVIVEDSNPRNVLYGTDSYGGPRLVQVDGFGERNLIPQFSISRWHNALHTRRKFQRMREKTAALSTATVS